MSIRAIGDRRTNAQLIVDCRELGYVRDEDYVLDATYGLGRFWTAWAPDRLLRNDADPTRGDVHHDFRDFPWFPATFAAVVFDPPYKYAGTASSGGPGNADVAYGIRSGMNPDDRDRLIVDGARECARVTKRTLLVKCMDQVVGGKKRWQTIMVTNALAGYGGLRLVDQLHVQGYRKQPDGRKQRHAHGDYSTLLVFQRDGGNWK